MAKPKLIKDLREDNDVDYAASIYCPNCESIGLIDEEQFNGEVSMICQEDGCDYHETHDLGTLL